MLTYFFRPRPVLICLLWRQEVLGYNTVLNTDALGSGSVAGYYSVTGCRDPNNVADRGCMQGVPRHDLNCCRLMYKCKPIQAWIYYDLVL